MEKTVVRDESLARALETMESSNTLLFINALFQCLGSKISIIYNKYVRGAEN